MFLQVSVKQDWNKKKSINYLCALFYELQCYIIITDIIVTNSSENRRIHWTLISVAPPLRVRNTDTTGVFEGTAVTELIEIVVLEEVLVEVVVVVPIVDGSNGVPKMAT